MAICPRCAMNVSQDYYFCNNCGYRPLTFELTTYGYGLSPLRNFKCPNCQQSTSNFKCPNTNCGTRLDNVIYSKKLSKSPNVRGRAAWILMAAIVIFLFLSFVSFL